MDYYVEEFTKAERTALRRHVSNLDSPVFALTGLPQITAAALFARYSRSSKSLRRLLLDEFLDADGDISMASTHAGADRAAALFGRVLADYGDDSVAQLGGAHIACEQVSQPLAKAIEWGRLAAYLEQSTRYIPYTDRRDGQYRYYRDPEVLASAWGPRYTAAMDGLFDTYAAVLDPLQQHLDATLAQESDGAARKRALRALALDIARSLLPSGTVSNVGVFASGQALEQMVMRLRAHPLPEAQRYAELIRNELAGALPDFVSRLDRPDRGGAWVDYLRDTAASLSRAVGEIGRDASLGVASPASSTRADHVRLLEWDEEAELHVVAAALYPHSEAGLDELTAVIGGLAPDRLDTLFAAAVGGRGNRRHRPGRGFEHADYTFEVVSDYGAFRDLQRHRLLTIDWQRLTPSLGSAVPEAIVACGWGDRWAAAVDQATDVHDAIRDAFPQQAQYLVTLGHRIRYVIRMNAREAMHMIELRTSPQGHPSYRRICLDMHRLIRDVAGHRRIAGAMRFVGKDDVHLPRYAAEARQTADLSPG